MCGIAGFWRRKADTSAEQLTDAAGRMASCLLHRGPDAGGIWTKPEWGLALAHRRLSILDLSPAGAQPMTSHSGRYIIVFNGEIYNFTALRQEIDQTSPLNWHGHSDTEVILALMDLHGIDHALNKLNGMFAFAVIDQEKRALTLARDRFGEKPLYYGNAETGDFIFASELKSLKAYPAFNNTINRSALPDYFRYNYIGQDQSIYQNVRKLLPGHTMRLDLNTGAETTCSYWNAQDEIKSSRAQPLTISFEAAVEKLDVKLNNIVNSRMVSDVPLGSFLSGGIDSSLVTALMQNQSANAVKTFSIGFDDARYNEANHAKLIASHLKTDHTEFYVSPQDALNIVPELPVIYDEPFADSSQIPTLLLSRLARKHVTVALTGDGGDEIFGGYNRYTYGAALWQKMKHIPYPLRHAAGRGLAAIPQGFWHKLPFLARYGASADKIKKLANGLSASDSTALYQKFLTHWPNNIVLNGNQNGSLKLQPELNFTENMISHDLTHYLPDDILTKVDRAAMNASLETRVPFLDADLLRFVWQLPLSYRVQGNSGKIILKSLLSKYVPQALWDRPKTGFAVPIDHWLRHELRPWAEDLLDESRMRHEGYLNTVPIQRKWREHLSGQRNWQHHLWDVLMFQSWLRHNQVN